MENIFKKYIERSQVQEFEMKVFEPNFVPSRMPHRENEISILVDNFGKIFLGTSPKNMMIFGKSGTGKTAVVKFVGRELETLPDKKEKVKFIYMNCQIKDNAYSIMETLGNTIGGEQIPFTGWSIDRVYNALKNNAERFGGYVITVLDEIDRFVMKNGDDLLYQLTLLNSELNNSKIIIIGITNNLRFSEFLDPRVKSRLNDEKLVFSPYTSEDIYDILSDRLKIANITDFVSEGSLRLISTLASQENGDARKAIELLKASIETALANGDSLVEERHVFIAKSKVEYDAIVETIKTLPLQTKVLLISIAILKENSVQQITTGDVFETYKNITNSAGLPTLTLRRITDMLSDLDMLGLISANVKSMGRYGRTKIIDLPMSPSEIKKIILEDENLERLKNYTFKRQSTLFF